ncbi:MAG: hypothetical protein HYX79_02005 [Chloroflexi bacterium]|nr:hypothetical protein [Chloroflexota bacterium]
MRKLKKLIYDEKGQALPIVLALLMLGGLVITPTLDFAATSLKSGRAIKTNVNGVYAAEAGVEYVLWYLKNSLSPPASLPETTNGMSVAIQTIDNGIFTIAADQLIEMQGHTAYLAVDGTMAWDAGVQKFRYTITTNWQPGSGTPTIHLTEVGATLPLDYSYSSASAAMFASNLSGSEPNITTDARGAYILTWMLSTPYPEVSQSNPVRTQTFYITGTGPAEGDYAWVGINRQDIDFIGEITGTLYLITATATNPENGKTTAIVKADALLADSAMYIIYWQITK